MSYDLKKVDNSPLRDVWYQDVVEHFGVWERSQEDGYVDIA
jgi:hypothetical protein